jgi:hypothetical protein
MRKIGVAIFVVAVVAANLSAVIAASDGARQYTVTISTPQETIKVGDEVPIHVVLTNVSDHDIGIDRPPSSWKADCDYRIEIQGANGNVKYEDRDITACTTALPLGTDQNFLYLKPGEKLEGDTTLTQLFKTYLNDDGTSKKVPIFDFTYPGQYVIQFLRKTSIYSNIPEYVPSNKLTIYVTE